MKNSELWKDVKCTCEMECEKIWNEMWKDMKWSVNWIVKALWNEMKWIVNWVWKDMKWSVNWCEMKSSVWNRVWMDVNGYEWVWKDMKWISVRDSHWISQCEPNSSMRRFSKLRQTGTQLADLIRITRKVFKFSKCCCTPKANALAGSAAVRQLPSVNYCKALECLENGRQTWSHSSACEENKKTGLIIIFRKSATTNVPESKQEWGYLGCRISAATFPRKLQCSSEILQVMLIRAHSVSVEPQWELKEKFRSIFLIILTLKPFRRALQRAGSQPQK